MKNIIFIIIFILISLFGYSQEKTDSSNNIARYCDSIRFEDIRNLNYKSDSLKEIVIPENKHSSKKSLPKQDPKKPENSYTGK